MNPRCYKNVDIFYYYYYPVPGTYITTSLSQLISLDTTTISHQVQPHNISVGLAPNYIFSCTDWKSPRRLRIRQS